ncbi:nucleotidyltransferase domain-containing protein [Occultella gossypii]|uniref:Nucleotidyltransferase domain-containing protein n=1 Tax=Occultella gossypii TaxID=2800820 RepID=A0ABS7S8T7_9MICO|nr:nucleotidyltransferase domain-containing protein [Occultella gossypii]MBZ2196702.1 nucleotidyltransferase domain-containing protein [Occultella gossypii]
MEHHEAALTRYVRDAAAQETTLAVVLVGSVARGTERPDSDLDVYLVVDDDAWDAAAEANRLAWSERHDEDYPGGYVDIKLASPSYLAAAADRGDDPTRASFAGARVVFSALPGIEASIAGLATLPEQEWDRRVDAHLAQARLHGRYFLGQAHASGDEFLRRHAALHLGLAAARCVLAANRTLLRGPKYVTDTLTNLPDLPTGFLPRWQRVLAQADPADAAALIGSLEVWLPRVLPREETLSTFIRDNELPWLTGALPAEYY